MWAWSAPAPRMGAATALENGAASVDMLIRRKQLPQINKSKGSGVPGLTHGQYLLPDEWKWRIRHYINAQQVPPPHGSTLRVSRHDNAFFNLGCAVQSATVVGDKLHVQTTAGRFMLDFLIISTGFAIDWSLRPEFADIAPHVKLWSSRFTPAAGNEDAELSASPDLGPLFEFQGDLPGIDHIHCFCYPLRSRMARYPATFPPSATARASWPRAWLRCSTWAISSNILPSCKLMPSPSWTARNGQRPTAPHASASFNNKRPHMTDITADITADTVDRLAGLAAGNPTHGTRHEREKSPWPPRPAKTCCWAISWTAH